MSTPSSPPPSQAWGFLPREDFQRLPPHPSVTQPGDPRCRAVASYDSAGAIQHFVLPLDRTKPPTIGHQVDILRGFWKNSPMGCDMCRRFFASAISVDDRCAFTFLEACSHNVETEAEDTGSTKSDDSHSYGSDDSSDEQDDDAENLATALITEDVGYNPIRGNLVVVKHTIVDNVLPRSLMEAEILDVLVEDFPVLRGLVLRSIVGDWEEASLQYLPSSYTIRRGSL
ncbi:hypothetical protein C8F01DRAFT_1256370 [Mycena amicta]|nr:hypothetical protein C8F01DRAFT_1260738 [Mycena amicta]KAJ7057751.1 hypothetical protein C8F01DRAFT_1256370 [Mycena amicta]